MRTPRSLVDVAVVGTGLWQAEPVGNDAFPELLEPTSRPAHDPYRGRPDDRGIVRIAGMELDAQKFARTMDAIQRAFDDPFRGAVRRRYYPDTLKVSEAEIDAARRAIADAGLEPGQIDAILVQSFLPDEVQPKNAALIAHGLGIHDAMAWGLDTVCNSVIGHLHGGASLINAGQAENVLCVVSTAYSRVRDPGVSTIVQEGDMAGAMVLSRRPGRRMDFSWRVDGRLHAAIRLAWDAPTGAARRAWWQPSQERLLIRFDGELQKQVMGEVAAHAKTVCDEALARAGMSVDEVDVFISHQPMVWYREFISDVLGLRDGVVYDTFAEYGNINSVSLATSLHHARLDGRYREGTRALFFAPAAGYTFAAAALRC